MSEDLSYLAGYFDAVGEIYNNKSFVLEVKVCGPSWNIVKRFHNAFGGTFVNRPRSKKNLSWWTVTGAVAKDVLVKLAPFSERISNWQKTVLEHIEHISNQEESGSPRLVSGSREAHGEEPAKPETGGSGAWPQANA